MQYEPLSQTDIGNLALLEIGQSPIADIADLNSGAAESLRAAFWPAVREVGRAHNWGCLRQRKLLTQLVFPESSSVYGCGTSIGWPGCRPSTPPPYWTALTAYVGGTLVTYGEAIYYCLQAYTSTANFINDLTGGNWAQIYSSFYASQIGANNNLYEWRFGYALPIDYLLLNELNGQNCMYGKGVGSLYEIFVNQIANADDTISRQAALFCDTPYADVKYTALIQDTTLWDPLFVSALSVLLASKIATRVRGDDGTMAAGLRSRYVNDVLPRAKMKDAGEGKPERYDPTRESNFLRARYNSTNG